jgi:Mor family transcriptional regulator
MNSPTPPNDDLIMTLTWRISQTIRNRLPELGEPLSESVAFAIINDIISTMGGQQVYFPRKMRPQPELIRSAFNGRNVVELARENGLTRQRIYQILNGGQ